MPPQSPQRFSGIRGCQCLPNRGRPGNHQTAISGPVSASYGSFSRVICSTCSSRLLTRFAAHGSGKDEGLRPQHLPGLGPLGSSHPNSRRNCRWQKGRTVPAGHPRWRAAPNANSSTATLEAGFYTPEILPSHPIKAYHLHISRPLIFYKFEAISYNKLSTCNQGT